MRYYNKMFLSSIQTLLLHQIKFQMRTSTFHRKDLEFQIQNIILLYHVSLTLQANQVPQPPKQRNKVHVHYIEFSTLYDVIM
jgi:hypothetical protein